MAMGNQPSTVGGKRILQRVAQCIAAAALVAAPVVAHAKVEKMTLVEITRLSTNTVVDSKTDKLMWGGCLALLSDSPSNYGLDCPSSNFVTFDCIGEFSAKSDALRLYDAAQLGYVTKKRVNIWVDDTRKHNGYCLATRIDIAD